MRVATLVNMSDHRYEDMLPRSKIIFFIILSTRAALDPLPCSHAGPVYLSPYPKPETAKKKRNEMGGEREEVEGGDIRAVS